MIGNEKKIHVMKRQDSLESTEGSDTKVDVDEKDIANFTSCDSTQVSTPVNSSKAICNSFDKISSHLMSSRSVRFADEVDGGALTEEYIVESYKHVSSHSLLFDSLSVT